MAPADEAAYLPSLDKCLNGNLQLLSWKNIFTTLTENKSRLDTAVGEFLSDDETIEALCRALDNPPAPTSQTRAAFDTYTSAINVTPTPNGRYDINQIKEDTLWLSKESKISEISALRLTVLEWQSRPTTRLLRPGLGEDESNVLRRGSIGPNSSFPYSKRSLARLTSPANETGAQDLRRAQQIQLLGLYLSERQYLAKTLHLIIAHTLIKGPSKTKGKSSISARMIIELVGANILRSWNLDDVRSGSGKNFFIDAVGSLKSKLQSLSTGSGWFKDDGGEDELELLWIRSHILEMIHFMQTILILTSSMKALNRSDVVLAWFQFTNSVDFLAAFDLSHPDMSSSFLDVLRSLIALVSLSFIQLPLALESLQSMPTLVTSGVAISGKTPYLKNIKCIEEITRWLLAACSLDIQTPSLAIFAWSMILENIRGYANSSLETKELRQSQRAVDTFNPSQHSDNENSESSLGRGRPTPQRRSSFGSDTSQQTTFLEDVHEMVRDLEPNGDLINFLARSAVDGIEVIEYMRQLSIGFCTSFGLDGTGLQIRLLLLDLARTALAFLDYQPDIITTIISIILGAEDYRTIIERPSELLSVDPATVFLSDEYLMNKVFGTALARFPYESLPFMQMCRALASAENGQSRLMEILENIGTFTTDLIEKDAPYTLTGEGENIYVELTNPLDTLSLGFPSLRGKPRLLLSGTSSSGTLQSMSPFQLPQGTTGRSLRDGKPLVVLWRYSYSGLRYMGCVLQVALVERSKSRISSTEDIFEIAAEIVAILTSLIRQPESMDNQGGIGSTFLELAHRALEEASDGLNRNQDIVTVILDLFEGELHRDQSGMSERSSSEFLLRTMDFIRALLVILPNRVWPFLNRSGLLGLRGNQSRLAAIIAVSELTSGRYELLLSSIRLFEALVEDALTNKVTRKTVSNSLTRFGPSSAETTGSGVMEPTMSQIILQFERIMVDVFESSHTWKFVLSEEKLDINFRICRLFDRLLSLCYENDDEPAVSKKLTGCLAPAADYLIDVFLSSSINDATVKTLIRPLLEGLYTPCSTLSVKRFQLWQLQTIAALNLNTRLLQVNQYLGRSAGGLAQHLFDISQALVTIYATCETYRRPVIQLFIVLVRSVDKTPGQPPSLLGQLGQTIAKDFLETLSVFDQPYKKPNLSSRIWGFLSAIVSHRQQWFAIYLLTGRTPKESLRNREQSPTTGLRIRPILHVALANLSCLTMLDLIEAASTLEFIALAADFWPWVINEIEKDNRCMKACFQFLASLRPPTARESGTSEAEPFQLQVAAYIVNIVAMLVHQSNDRGNSGFAKSVLPGLKYLLERGVSVPSYNVSLHSSLRKNFESTFPGCKLSSFKQTSLKPARLGKYFYYDLRLANQMLPHDGTAWSDDREKGFAKEFIRANINLSIVEAQVNLFYNWKSLISELGQVLGTDRNFQKSLAVVIGDCLRSNLENALPELIFSKLAQSRADLAFLLLQQLVSASPTGPEAKEMLKLAWDTLLNHAPDLGIALTGDEAEYDRTLLKVLYLSLQAHLSPSPVTNARGESREALKTTMMIVDILGVAVARGFRSLTTRLHENPSKVLPADFALFNAILRTALHIPGVDKHSEQLVIYFSDENTSRYASTLLSWTHQLTVETDPVFGELSITFLLELSSVPALAESIVIGGCLAQIASANIVDYFRRPGGFGPFDQPSRIYSIWTRGILPLVINLVRAIGAPIASEIASFLNQFKPQLMRASNSLNTKPLSAPRDMHSGHVSLAMASELRSLALITTILGMFREAGASAGIVAADVAQLEWDRLAVKEDLEERLQRRNALRDSIVATDEREEAWSRQKATHPQGGSESKLEEKIVEELTAALAILEDEE